MRVVGGGGGGAIKRQEEDTYRPRRERKRGRERERDGGAHLGTHESHREVQTLLVALAQHAAATTGSDEGVVVLVDGVRQGLSRDQKRSRYKG